VRVGGVRDAAGADGLGLVGAVGGVLDLWPASVNAACAVKS